MSRLRERIGEPKVYDAGTPEWDRAVLFMGDCMDPIEGEKLMLYGDTPVYVNRSVDGHYWTVVGNEDIYDADLAKVEDWLFEKWVDAEYPVMPAVDMDGFRFHGGPSDAFDPTDFDARR